PYQIMSTADGRFALAVGNDRQFAALCSVLACPELASDARYRTNRARVLNRKTLIPRLEGILASQPNAYWLEKIRAAGIPAGSVRSVPEALDAPEIAARGLIADTPDARHGSDRLMRSPMKWRGTPQRAPVAPQRLGEHTEHILHSVLNSSQEQIQAWCDAGVIA